MNIVIQKKDKQLNDLNEAYNNGKHVFLFISADWCDHCKIVKPEWFKLKQNNYGPDVVIVNVDSEIYKNIKGVGPDAEGFPDFRYISKLNGIEKFNDGRTYEAFDQWIKSKSGKSSSKSKSKSKSSHNKTNKHIKGMIYGGTRKRSKRKIQKRRR